MKSALAAAAMAAAFVALPVAASAQDQIPPELRPEARQLAQSCRSDVQRLCSTVPRGQGRILMCLQDNFDQTTPACQEAVISISEKIQQLQQGG